MSVNDAGNSDRSYDPSFFDPLFANEERHFWFRARNRVIVATVRNLVARLRNGYRVLEVGCGTGNVLRALAPVCAGGSLVGMDLFEEGLSYARRRVQCELVQGDIHHPPFNKPFDLIAMFDVLEHLEGDSAALRAVSEMLVNEGRLVLTVPAHQELWSYFDEASCHRRRYSVKELRQKLGGAGFQVEFISEFMMALFPLIWGGRRAASKTKPFSESQTDRSRHLASNELKVVPVINEILFATLSMEAPLLARGLRLPFGSSILVVARKMSDKEGCL